MTEWQAILARHDQSMLLMFGGVLSYALNWYVFENSAAIRRIMTVVPTLACLLVIGLEIAA
jgi:hypothetical protein